MTGLPCSGKTTISRKLSKRIFNLAVLDGDEMREWLSPNEDFSRRGINEHNKKVVNLAKLLCLYFLLLFLFLFTIVFCSLVLGYFLYQKNSWHLNQIFLLL